MFVNLNKRLEEVLKKNRELDRLQGKLENLKININKKQNILHSLEENMIKELKDVDKLQKLSVSSLLYMLMFKKDEMLYKEQKEYIEAKSKVEECTKELNILIEEKEYVEGEITKLGDVEKEYQEIFREKEDFIKSNLPEDNKRIIELSEEISINKSEAKELREAINEGDNLLNAIENLMESLNGARNWGTVDMLGGGLLSTHLKHQHIDEARDYMSEVKRYLGRFQRELKDVYSEEGLDINIGSFATFADYFFDSFFVDWYIQSSIKEALSNTSTLKDRIEDIIKDLKNALRRSENALENLKKERIGYIENLEVGI
ncbi:hypothetical protein SAMN05444401_3603 [Clostridium amylolyticum]|uniref:Uncharacterized protein n=1 Tax=Clostridium amylolyticum TaxID=1121298 RepID=A0A1M6LE12_9CLOT|nr:hypothetical protein [Clostridium amylolyticum]SHJ69397.1 hypothetical protein SAMN05444401_3603 [Clostridium amylolyticum]